MTRALWLLLVTVLVLVGVLVAMAWTRAQVAPIGSLATRSPERTALMRQREAEARRKGERFRVDRRWVSYSRISPLLRRAVLVAEDDAFFAHGGLDWNEIQKSAKENWRQRRIARGGSTITQQLAKNLFLGDERTPTRKLAELFLALRMERALSKRRIFELYLNEIEWGDGIFGVEAAARGYFGVPASRLNARQAVLLAAVIINPRRFSPTSPSRRIERRAKMIAGRLRRRGFLDEAQYRLAIGAPAEPDTARKGFSDWFFGPAPDTAAPAPVPDEIPEEPRPDSLPPEPEPADTAGLTR